MTVSTPDLAKKTLAHVWPEFAERLSTLHSRLQQEIESCWGDVLTVLEPQSQQLHQTAEIAQEAVGARSTRHQLAKQLLHEPLAQWERRRPYQRALLAFESYDHALAELSRALPEFVDVNGKQALDVLEPWAPTTFTRRLTWWRRSGQRFPLASSVGETLKQIAWQRVGLEGRFLLTVAEGLRQLRRNWAAACAELDSAAAGESDISIVERGTEIKRWATLQREAQGVLAEWQTWPAQCHCLLANSVLNQVVRRQPVRPLKARQGRALYHEHWSEQGHSLAGELRFEAALERCEDRLLAELRETFDSLQEEARRLALERDEFIAWLRKLSAGAATEPMPQPQVSVVPAASRISELKQSLRAVLPQLPDEVVIPARYRAAPRRFARSFTLHPRETLRVAFRLHGQTPLTELLQRVEADHQAIVREVEHAREVVLFGLGENAAERDAQIAKEALENALSLLEFNRDEMRDWRGATVKSASEMITRVFLANRLALSRNRLGALSHLWQEGLLRGSDQARRALLEALRAGMIRGLISFKAAGERVLISIGWLPEPGAGPGELVRRPLLPIEFTEDLGARDLPAIYRRLFRFDPVEDPRFLIGREEEMAALAEARSLWEVQRPVSVLLVGERGSGKTSLINCALAQPLADLQVTRGEFHERLHTAAALREFLAELLEAPVAELETALAATRRVIILEELERAFLRQIGHFEAQRELQRLIAASCKTTLWIVVTNQIAFRLLNAAVGLGHSFSHRLNTASVSSQALREAILFRHNLSGLRLQFGARAVEQGRLYRLLRRLRGQPNPEQEFFARLARESAGVFRAAFEIWLGQIEAARGGALYMKPLVTPDLSPVIDDLDQKDLFTLVSVMQHGSVTPEEIAIIFQKTMAASQAQLDELLAREIIEPDPGRPGFRVRPEAMRVVQEALFRRNLV